MNKDKIDYIDFLKSYTNRGTGDMGVRTVSEMMEDTDKWNCPVHLKKALTAAQDKIHECGVNEQCKRHWTEIENAIYDRLKEIEK